MCRSQQVKEITETSESSEEECNLIQAFDSLEEFEIMSEELNDEIDNVDGLMQWRLENIEKCKKQYNNNSEISKI